MLERKGTTAAAAASCRKLRRGRFIVASHALSRNPGLVFRPTIATLRISTAAAYCYCPIRSYRLRYEIDMSEIERIERRISLHDLRVLMSVVEAGSMGKAAKQLATSQPAISRSISELESALGVRLLDRSPQGIEPTPYGRALLKRGISVFDELGQGTKDIRFLADPTAGQLRIGASIAVAAGFVSSLIA